MIKFLIRLKKFIVSNTRIRKLVHYKKELTSDDFSSQQATSSFNGDISFQYFPKATSEILNFFQYRARPRIEDHTACMIVRIKNEPAGAIFLDAQPLVRLIAPFRYEIKLGANSAYLHGLFIEKKFRGKGLARLLYIEALKILQKRFKYAHGLVEEDNFIANNLIREVGFKRIKSFALIKILNFKIIYPTNNVFEEFLLRFLIYLAKKIYRFIRLPITIFENFSFRKKKPTFKLLILADSKTNGSLTVAYFCRDIPYLRLAHRMFPEGYEIKKSIKFLETDLEKEINNTKNSVDLLIIEDDFKRLYKRFKNTDEVKFIPKLVLQKNNSLKSIENLFLHRGTSLHTDFNLIKRFKYTHVFSRDVQSLRFFYENMYVPYMKNRHNIFAYIAEFNAIQKCFKKGGLIFIKQGNKFISGGVIELYKNGLRFTHLGILNGDVSLIKKGALSSLYYFMFKLARERSLNVVDLGHSRGFLDDGLLRYKAKWNTKVSFNKKQSSTFLLKIVNFTPAIKSFLLRNPFITIENKRSLVGNIFLDNETYAHKNEYINKFKVDGLDKLRIVCLNGSQNKTTEELINLKVANV